MTIDKDNLRQNMEKRLNELKKLLNEKSGSEKRLIKGEIEFIEICLERGYYILGQYVDSKTCIKMMCPQEHITETMRPGTFKRDHLCKDCWNENRSRKILNSDKNIAAKEEFFRLAKEAGYKVIGEYVNANTPIRMECERGHITDTLTPSHFKGGTRCKECYKEDRDSGVNLEIGKVYEQNKGSKIKVIELCKVENNDGKRDGLKYKCCVEECGYEGVMRESSFKEGVGCASCNGKEIVIGYNDINTTDKELVDTYFKNKEDGKRYKRTSNKKIPMICPDCWTERDMVIEKLTRQGLACHSCGDGFSIPHKMMFNVLMQLIGYNFIPEDSPKWIGKRRYDFSFSKVDLPNVYKENLPKKYNNIDIFRVEMDGDLGHGKDNTLSGVSGEDSKKIDDLKDDMAKQNNNYVIRIDCRYKDENPFEYIKNNIINSELAEIFNIEWHEDIDWNGCIKFSKSSRVIEVINLYNNGIEIVTDIIKNTKISRGTIIDYLKWGDNLNLCYYPKIEMNMVCCLDKNKKGILLTQKEWQNKSQDIFGEKLLSSRISSVVNGSRNHYKGYRFKKYKDLTLEEKINFEVINDFDKLYYDENIKIYCKEKNIQLNMKEWIEQGEEILGIDKVIGECITRVIKGERENYKGFHFEEIIPII